MKNGEKLRVFAVFFILLMIAGCSSGPKMYDKTVPLEECALLLMPTGVNPTGEMWYVDYVDGEYLGTGKVWYRDYKVYMPAGEYELSIRHKMQSGDAILSDVILNLKAGRTYQLSEEGRIKEL